MKITMKMYENYLNQLGVPKDDQYKNGGRCRGKKYGSWLRRSDKDFFHIMYNTYVKNMTHQECTKIKKLPIHDHTISKTVDYSEGIVVKEITAILKRENIEKECHILTPKEFKSKEYTGQSPLVMISSTLESTFISEFIEECIPKDKYFLNPCSYYMLGVYPKKEISTKQKSEIDTKLMVG
ncbi:hypothetical protein [Marinisporobacter balticus]|uniref:Uncharacterized protein n=1 Tax=Marinisporobacter balticus TaxID=2018667 RepID=A0A4R2KI64_9FIRM|nr:hypothetical protein [Marinisporobacter balticus]TCO69688.1 hypothetical protein EV214_13024 [Marinisporobacter balticus]